MTARVVRTVLTSILFALAFSACGKKGNPLPPLRPVPARIADLAAVRTAGQVELRFTVPAANLDGSAPVVIDRVDIFGLRATAGEAPPAAGQIASNPGNLIESLPIRRAVPPEGAAPEAAVSTLVPLPGAVAVYVHRTEAIEQAGAAALHYVAVPVAGTGRGRPGPPTPVATVALGPLPAPPTNLAVGHDESTIRITWTPAASGQAFRVVRLAGGEPRTREPLSPKPVPDAEFATPVEFGRELCVAVQAVQVSGPVSIEGPPSDAVCTTPVDRYPPPVPGGLRVVQEGTAVTLIWDAVEAADLAGYVVLRADGAAAAMAPLVREPLKATSYRDTTAAAGATYSYAVYSVDSSPGANVSALSARETLTVR